MNKVWNYLIILVLVVILGVGVRLFISYQYVQNEIYNNNIIDFTVDFLSGKKEYSKIEELDCNDAIKDSLKQWYNDKFYSDEDVVLVFEDINYYDSIKDKIKSFYNKNNCDSMDSESYMYCVAEEFDDVSIVLFASDEVEGLDENRIKEMDYYLMFDNGETNFEYIKKDGNLYIKTNDIVFDKTSSSCECHYDGITNILYKDILEKKVWKEYAKENLSEEIKVIQRDINKNNKVISLSNGTSFSIELKGGKIKNLSCKG